MSDLDKKPVSPDECGDISTEETPEERYLWDPSAPPDPTLRALEERLAALRPLPALDLRTLPARAPIKRTRAFVVVGALALAAALAAIGLRARSDPRQAIQPDRSTPSALPIAPEPAPILAEGPAFAWRALRGDVPGDELGKLRKGGWLETDAGTRVRLDVADIGHVDVDPGSRVGLLASGPDGHHLSLAVGRLSAQVSAVPRLFVIETKRARAVDLGCAYDLWVDETGEGMLTVQSGAVELEGGAGRALPVVVPQGAECGIDRERGPRTPVWSRLSPEGKAAMAGSDRDRARLDLLDRALATLGARDSLTLLHLLETAPPARRGAILDRLVAIQPLPPGLRRSELLEGARDALLRYREAVSPRWYRGPPGNGAWSPEQGAGGAGR